MSEVNGKPGQRLLTGSEKAWMVGNGRKISSFIAVIRVPSRITYIYPILYMYLFISDFTVIFYVTLYGVVLSVNCNVSI